MKSIALTLIIVGGILILAPIVAANRQREQIVKALPYLAVDVDHPGATNCPDYARAAERLTAPLGKSRYGCAILGTLMIIAGAVMGGRACSCCRQRGAYAISGDVKIQVEPKNS